MCALLKDRLPIWEVAADYIISKTGALTCSFECSFPEIFSLSEADIGTMHQSWRKALAVLLPDTMVHLQHWYWRRQWQPDRREFDKIFLEEASDAHFKGRPWLQHTCNIYITKRPKRKGFQPGRTLIQRSLAPPDTMSPTAIHAFKTTVDQFTQILIDSGLVQIRPLSEKELVSSPGQIGKIEQYCQLLKPNDDPLIGDVDFNDGIRIGGKYCLLHTIADAHQLPAECGPLTTYRPYSGEDIKYPIGSASTLGILLPHDHIVNHFISIEEPSAIQKQLELKGRRMQSLAPHARENVLGKIAVDEFLNELAVDHHQLVKAHINIMSFTDNIDELQAIGYRTASAITRTGAVPHLETIGAAQIWAAGIPGNAADLPYYEMFDCFAAHAISYLIPDSHPPIEGSDMGVRYGDRIHGAPVHVDLSDEPMQKGLIANRNKFVLGGSG